ncbi:hypothetical protein C8F01DRAFT_1250526 [Mycena amicta]|nr:hypothetical protein C8F01DRAFT_1250526 [Mycena amicta]
MSSPPQQPLLASPAPPQYSAVEAPLPYVRRRPPSRCASCCRCCCGFFLLFAFVSALLVALAMLWPTPPTMTDRISDAIPRALKVRSCVQGRAEKPQTVKTYTFALPLHAETVLVLSRYQLAGSEANLAGNVRITTSTVLPPNTAHVVVVPASLGHATVCSLVSKTENDTSVSAFGVFATGPEDSYSPNLNITLVLPASTNLAGLQTSLPDFAYDVDDLVGAGVDIVGAAFITGGEKPIRVKSISAVDRLLLSTWNSSVSAGFARSTVLDVSTGTSPSSSPSHTNASISGTYAGSYVRLITSNAPIDARFSVSSGVIDAYTANASLALEVLPLEDDTEDSKPMKLRLRAVTSDAAATVRLPAAYEGHFRLLGASTEVREPKRQGDARTVKYHYDGPAFAGDDSKGIEVPEEWTNTEVDDGVDGNLLTGAVYLTEEGMQRGWVSVLSTGGGTRLIL